MPEQSKPVIDLLELMRLEHLEWLLTVKYRDKIEAIRQRNIEAAKLKNKQFEPHH